MEGDIKSESEQGVIPRAVRAIFEDIGRAELLRSCVKVSYLEIYNEELSDLLLGVRAGGSGSKVRKPPKLTIVDDDETGRGVHCHGLSEVEVSTAADVLGILEKAQERRRVAETKLNKASSRSHCVFSVSVATAFEHAGALVEKCGRLHLVDLAGSECAKQAGLHEGAPDPSMERERKNINQSLLTLGRVILALQKKSRSSGEGRTPYRDSKLTRILQASVP